MKKVNILLKNAIVLTIDKDFNVYEPGGVAILGNTIVAVGIENDITGQFEADETIDCKGNVLMPGLINAHTHLPMALLRGVMDDLNLHDWLFKYIFPIEGKFMNENTAVLGAKLGVAESILSGVTCVSEMYYYETAIAKELEKIGIRASLGRCISCSDAVDGVKIDDKYIIAENFLNNFKDSELINPYISPHAPYTNNEDTIKKAIDFAKKHNIILNMHLAETQTEVNTLTEKYGSVAGYLEELGFNSVKCNFAHCVHLSDKDIEYFAKHNMGVAHCPTSNMKLVSGIAPTAKMLNSKVNLGIGTDGNSSNNDLDMWEEMRMASFLAKVSTGNPTALNAKDTIYMATLGGAKSIFLDHKIGSLEKGKKADLILVDIHTLHNSPRFRHNTNGIYGQLVYSTKSTDVTDVLCNGKWLLKNRNLITIETAPLIEEAQGYATQIDSFVNNLKKNNPA